MSNRAAASARDLSSVLLAEADNLASNDLATVSAAMTAVRAAARDLEASLTARGWGGDVLYGFGQPLDDEQEFDDDDDDEDEDEFDEGLEEEAVDSESRAIVQGGRRMSYQARWDFILVDEEALVAYVEARAAASGTPWPRAEIFVHGPVAVLTELVGFSGMDFTDTGLVLAGGQDTVRDVPATLWEMGEESDDQFPTSM